MKALDTTELLALICKALSERHPLDPCKPGIQVSHLDDKALWYVAVHRYTQPFGDGRVVVTKRTGDDLDAVLIEIAKTLTPQQEAQRDLESFLKQI